MKLAIGLALGLALAAAASAQQPAVHAVVREPGPPPPMTGAAVSTPMSFVGGMPTIEVTVNGKGPFRVAFDTGAMGGVHLSAGAAERAGLGPVGEALAGDPSGKNLQHIKLYGLAQVGVGGRAFTGMVFEAPPMHGALEALDGVAGLGVLGGALVTMDYAHGRFTAEPGALPAPDGRTVFAYQGPIPRVPVSIEGRTLEAHLDTGNVRAGVIVPDEFAQGLSGHAAATEAGVAHTISSAIPMHALKLAAAPRIGDTALAVSDAQYPSVIAIGNVGSPALAGLVVRVDTLNRRVQVIAPPAGDKPS